MAKFVMISMVLAVVLLKGAAAQTVHMVGGSMRWIVPHNSGAAAFETWAAAQKFVVGDILTFNYTTGRHNVQEVPKASFDGCTASNPIGNLFTEPPVNITLNSTGDHYYICTIDEHCQRGQKLAITVSGSPSPNDARDGVLAGVFVPMMAVVMGLFF